MKALLVLLIFSLITSEFLVLSDEQKDSSEVKNDGLENKTESVVEEENVEINKESSTIIDKNQEDIKITENSQDDSKPNEEASIDDRIKTFPRKMLARRREEHLQLLKGIAQNPKYEWRFQLVELGVTKVLDLIHENKKKEAKGGSEDKINEFKLLIIENSCLLMDFIVNFNYNNDIYVILKKAAKKGKFDWKESLKFSLDYLEKEIDMLDELTTKEFEFVKENFDAVLNQQILPEYPYENNIKRDINIAERIYENEKQYQAEIKNKKDKKKGKKGPSLQLPPLKSKTEL